MSSIHDKYGLKFQLAEALQFRQREIKREPFTLPSIDKKCPLCGDALRHWFAMPIDAKKNLPTPFNEVHRCGHCQLGMLHPQPSAGQISELYVLPAYYTHGESHIRSVSPGFLDKVLTKIAWILDRASSFNHKDIIAALPPGAEILDLGCGDGNLLEKFRQQGFNVLGVDPDEASRRRAAERNVPVLDGTAEIIPSEISRRQFNLVLMTHALEHCRQPKLALQNAYSLTRPGGLFYAEVPNCGCIHFETLGPCSEMFDSPRHLWFFSAGGLRQIIESTGFVFAGWRFEGFTRHHSPSWRGWEKQIFARLQARKAAAGATRHTYLRSVSILIKSAFAPMARKYDCVGVLARKPMPP